MKFITILLLTYYFIKLIDQNFAVGNLKKFNNLVKDKSQDDLTDMLKDTGFIKLFIKTLLEVIISLSIGITEFFYIFFAIQYGNKVITLGYFILWMALLIAQLLRYKFSKNKENKEAKKFSLFVFIINIIDFAYFGYMYYVLFWM